MQEHTIELALARVDDCVPIMYDNVQKYEVISDQIFRDTVDFFANFPSVPVDASPEMPSTWTNEDRYAFICRVVTVMRKVLEILDERSTIHRKHHIVVGISKSRLREFTQALGTLATGKPSAIVHSQYLILATCVHKAS